MTDKKMTVNEAKQVIRQTEFVEQKHDGSVLLRAAKTDELANAATALGIDLKDETQVGVGFGSGRIQGAMYVFTGDAVDILKEAKEATVAPQAQTQGKNVKSFAERIGGKDRKQPQNHIEIAERLIARAYLEVMAEEAPELEKLYHQHIRKRVTLEELSGDMENTDDRKQRIDVMDTGAKFADAKRGSRKIAGVNEAIGIQEMERAQKDGESALQDISRYGDNIYLVLKAFKEQGLTSAQVEDIIEANTMNVSLTGHPVNPRASEYIKTVMDLDRVLENPEANYADLKEALRAMVRAEYTAVPKTSNGMIDEALDIATMVREASTRAYQELEAALHQAGYADVQIRSPLVKLAQWHGGDGDGNPNADKAALEYAIKASREREIQSQVRDLHELAHAANTEELHGFAVQLHGMAHSVEHGEYKSYKEVAAQLKTLSANFNELGNEDLADKVEAATRRIERFQGHATTIDIRHGSEDITPTVARLAEVAGLLDNEAAEAFKIGKKDSDEIKQAKHDKQQDLIAGWLADPEAIAKLKAVKEQDLIRNPEDEEGKTAARIFGRMQTVAENPEMSDKFIVANTGHAAHILGAMLISNAAGVVVAEEGASMNFVPLVESKAELGAFPNDMLRPLLENETFRAHVEAMDDKMIVMVAKSDTVRQDSMSAIYFQSEAFGQVTLTAAEYDVDVEMFIGGGGSRARGSTRLSKNANAVGAAVIHEALIEYKQEHGRVPTNEEMPAFLSDLHIGTVHATVQGPDMQAKLSGVRVAEHTILTVVSENMLAYAQVQGLIPAPEIYGRNEQEREAIVEVKELLQKAFQAGVDKYHDYLEQGTIDKLGQEGYFPAVSNLSATTSLGNRPAKRGKKLPQEGLTPEEIEGSVSKGLVQNSRAIVVDRMLAHAGNYATGYLGQDAVFETLLGEEGQKIAEKYGHLFAKEGEPPLSIGELAYKLDPSVFGDFVRREAELTYMTDFEHNWRLGGNKRPDDADEMNVAKLAAQFDITKDNSAEVTLAHFEMTALKVAGYVYETARGKTPEEFQAETGREFTINDAFRELNPEVAAMMERSERAREGEFARFREEELNQHYRERSNQPLTREEFREAVYSYAGAESPIGEGEVIARTNLRLHGKGGMKVGSADLEAHIGDDIPAALQDFAREKGIPLNGNAQGAARG